MSKKGTNDSFINARSFIAAIVIIAILMILCYISTLALPCEGIPFWKFILSPFLVLGSSDNVTIIAVLIFLLTIGGVFNSINKCGIMRYMIDKVAYRYGNQRYRLMALIILIFMALGSVVGVFEEVVPLVPIIVALSIELGWDALTGISMSLLAVGCGFAAGVFNPFTVGVAQELAGLPIFSGAWFRGLSFVIIYALLFFFIKHHAKKVDTGISKLNTAEFKNDKYKDKGVFNFAVIVITGILIIISSTFLTFLRDYTFVIITIVFLIAGIVSCLSSKMNFKTFIVEFKNGVISMLPAVLMILMASSIKYILQTAGVLDIVVEAATTFASGLPQWSIILFIYLIVLIMNFFIPSGSAKAIMLIPLLVPLALTFNIPAQLVIVAYAFGDGFSNILYPTNPALLISLGLADTNYISWFKHSGKFQLLNLVATSGLLLLGFVIGLE